MTDQTPSTEDDLTLTIEDVRYRYAYESRYQEVLESDLAEFDDWLAAHDRAVKAEAKAEALREVAARVIALEDEIKDLIAGAHGGWVEVPAADLRALLDEESEE